MFILNLGIFQKFNGVVKVEGFQLLFLNKTTADGQLPIGWRPAVATDLKSIVSASILFLLFFLIFFSFSSSYWSPGRSLARLAK